MAAIALLSENGQFAARLRPALEAAGFETEAARIGEIRSGELDLLIFLEEYDPDLIVYELAPPYPHSLTFMRLLQSTPLARRRRWLLATTDRQAVVDLLGPTDAVLDIPARNEDPGSVVQGVRRELEQKLARHPEAA
jgi:hypothetical protein